MNRSTTLAIMRALILLGLVVFIVSTQRPAMALRLKAARTFPGVWHRLCRRAMGMEVKVRGQPLADGPAFFVANHISYLDVTAIGSVIDGCFVARADLRGWPVFGYLSTLQRTIFVERRPRHARAQMQELTERLRDGDRLILFPEGTSGDGNTILPFKSTLFGVAEIKLDGKPVPVQPVSVAYTRLDGLPIGRLLRPLYAWYGDMEFAPHFWRMLGFGRFQVELTFHQPVTVDQFSTRKELARHCERAIGHGFARSIAGRADAEPAAGPQPFITASA